MEKPHAVVTGAPNRRVVPGDGTIPSARRGGGYR